MSDALLDTSAGGAVARLGALVDDLRGVAWDLLDEDDLLRLAEELETHSRRMAAVQHVLVAQLEARDVAVEHGYRNTAALLADLLLIDRREAGSRVRAAAELGPRRGLTGERLEPQFPLASEALAGGTISPAHARVITRTIKELPPFVRQAEADRVEAELTARAIEFAPTQLAALAQAVVACLDPDGIEPRDDTHQRQRGFELRENSDGSSEPIGYLTPACTEALKTVLEATSAPAAAGADGVADPRTPAQRQHDGLLDACLASLRAIAVPNHHGVATTIVVNVDWTQAEAYTAAVEAGKDSARRASAGGMVTTGHGSTLSFAEALRLSGGDCEVVPLLTKNCRPVAVLDGPHRLATPLQRRILGRRDGGCSFPGCVVAPSLCQTHHIVDYKITGRTHVDELTLLCGWHHRAFEKLGWSCRMIDHRPHWIPPAWLDPHQVPRRNTAHIPAITDAPS